MSEETPPAKKAARKSVRKKSAKKSASTKSEASESAEEFPLHDSPDSGERAVGETPRKEKRSREPKSGVRDARREKPEDSESTSEVVEKLVPDPEQKERKDQKETRDSQGSQDQSRQRDRDRDKDSSDNGERRNRSRSRGRSRNDRGDRNDRRDEQSRPDVNVRKLKKKAWEIFESEVTEEGLALLDDNGLREYARSSFNAARLFLEEANRVAGPRKDKKKQGKKKIADSRSAGEESESQPTPGDGKGNGA